MGRLGPPSAWHDEGPLSAVEVHSSSLQNLPTEPPFPRAAEIDECVLDATSRVKRLHGLLTQWQLADMSHEQSAHLLAYVEEVLQHTRESSSALAAYDESVQQSLGPELCQVRESEIPLPSPIALPELPSPPRPQTLFWDLLDPAAAAPYSAHAFQRQQLPEIERRCAQLRVRAVAPVAGKSVEALEHGVERAIGHCTERGFEIQARSARPPAAALAAWSNRSDPGRAQGTHAHHHPLPPPAEPRLELSPPLLVRSSSGSLGTASRGAHAAVI